jgi:hypothetical protein
VAAAPSQFERRKKMTKRLALVAAVVAACLTAASGALAARPVPVPVGVPAPVQPQLVPVPAAVVAAHPNGQPGGLTAEAVLPTAGGGSTTNAAERVSCWRSYFTNDNSIPLGTEKEWINPYWCGGNGSVMRGVDSSWHGQTCSILVSCGGEGGVATWYGCANGCVSIGQQIDGQFAVHPGVTLYVTLTVEYELYPNGNYWSYTYHS